LFITRACRADNAQKIAVLKIRHPEGKPSTVTMDNSRELSSLLRRANRLSILQRPPALEMAVIHCGEEMPAPSPWRLTLQIEPKRVAGKSAQNAEIACSAAG
jgi:hypothetical protein